MLLRYWTLILLGGICGATSSNKLIVNVTNTAVPFYLQLLESLGDLDQQLYVEALAAICDEESDQDPDFTVGSELEDESIYRKVMNHLDLDQFNHSFVDLRISSEFYTPRILSHYEVFNQVEACKGHKTFLVSKDRVYCTYEDLFALQLSTKSDMSKELTSFDRVIGSNSKAPVLILYGDLHNERFREIFNNVYLNAIGGKIRFSWRYTPNSKSKSTSIKGYGSSLTLKDPKPIDSDLGIKLSSMILSIIESSKSQYKTLKKVLQDLPSYIDDIAHYEIDHIVAENAKANENMGISDGTIGMYINGSPVNRLELDTYKVINKLQEELNLIKDIIDLGLNVDQAKLLISKLALNLAVKQSQYSTDDINRYKVFEDEFTRDSKKGGVVFLNDIELDQNYEDYTTSRYQAYVESNINSGQLPELKENVHDLIFALDVSDKEQLKVLFSFSKVILDRGIPQQIGVIPLGNTELDQKIAKYFYFLYETTTAQEALGLLYQIFMRKDDTELDQMFAEIPISTYKFDSGIYEKTLAKYSLSTPSVVFNGIIHDLKSDSWRSAMGRQIAKDTNKLKNGITNDIIGPSLKAYLFNDAKTERDLRIFPKDISGFKYKGITKELIDKSTLFQYKSNHQTKFIEHWIIGDLSLESTFTQFIENFKLLTSSKYNIRLRVIDTSTSDILSKFKNGILPEDEYTKVLTQLLEGKLQGGKPAKLNSEIRQFLSKQGLPPNHSFLLVNSRYLKIENQTYLANTLEEVSAYEYQKIYMINEIMDKYPHIFNSLQLPDFHTSFSPLKYDDWQDILVSKLLKSFFIDDNLYIDDVARFDFSSMNLANSFVVDNQPNPLIDILVIIDPVLPSAQELISITEMILNVPYVRTRVLLQPKSSYDTITQRYFRGNYPSYPLTFQASKGEESKVEFNIEPGKYTLDMLEPKRWVVKVKPGSQDIDLDSIDFELEQEYHIQYELSSLLVEGFARNILNGNSPLGLKLLATKENSSKDTMIMGNLGYFSLGVEAGTWELSCQGPFDLLSASSNAFESNIEPQSAIQIDVYTMDGLVLSPRFIETDKPISTKKGIQQNADINIFTVVSGKLYEKLCMIMMLSIEENTKFTVKFWLIDDYLSPKFKQFLPYFSQQIGFEYEFVSYKWPKWLRSQVSRQRTIWGYKILFLDVLFPQELDQIIFVDADQINRNDMKKLVDLDMEDHVYGFVPMCESRKEMEGFRFWKQGYWSKVLGDDLKYHISALFKVNLKLFRERGIGDKLRTHYQKLSSDPNSLANLDQDLPNNLQRAIPIYSLPQDYLWCETWCSDEGLKSAKNIDLCNNPLTKENKLDTGRRLLAEWEDYEKTIEELTIKNEQLQKDILRNMELEDLPEEPEQIVLEMESEDEDDFFHDEL